MSFEIDITDSKTLNKFQSEIKTIKNYLANIGDTYLLVAYHIYEMYHYESFKPWYENIVDACEKCLGFKKSTTYNMLNIVKRFGTAESSGFIPYQSLFGYRSFSYSQLTEMLSLSDKQLQSVSSETTVKEIRTIKRSEKVQTSGKVEDIPLEGQASFDGSIIESIDNTVIEVSYSESEVQTSVNVQLVLSIDELCTLKRFIHIYLHTNCYVAERKTMELIYSNISDVEKEFTSVKKAE